METAAECGRREERSSGRRWNECVVGAGEPLAGGTGQRLQRKNKRGRKLGNGKEFGDYTVKEIG